MTSKALGDQCPEGIITEWERTVVDWISSRQEGFKEENYWGEREPCAYSVWIKEKSHSGTNILRYPPSEQKPHRKMENRKLMMNVPAQVQGLQGLLLCNSFMEPLSIYTGCTENLNQKGPPKYL